MLPVCPELLRHSSRGYSEIKSSVRLPTMLPLFPDRPTERYSGIFLLQKDRNRTKRSHRYWEVPCSPPRSSEVPYPSGSDNSGSFFLKPAFSLPASQYCSVYAPLLWHKHPGGRPYIPDGKRCSFPY